MYLYIKYDERINESSNRPKEYSIKFSFSQLNGFFK